MYLEPYLGLGLLIGDVSTSSANNSDTVKGKSNNWLLNGGLYTGTALGARVGYKKLGLAFGLDFNGNYNYQLGASKEKESFITILPGAFVSYKFPILFRVYGTIIPYGFLKNAPGSIKEDCLSNAAKTKCPFLQTNIKNEKPIIRSLKLGVGYTGLPFLNINLEYQPFYFIATGNTKREGFWTHGITAYVSYIF